ncbi:MAG: glycosyltransferase family 4 protein [Candidatus Bathyarchaeia archaeon]
MKMRILFHGGRGYGFAQDMYDYVFKPLGAKQCKLGTSTLRYSLEALANEFDLIWCDEEEGVQALMLYLMRYYASVNRNFRRLYKSSGAKIISRLHYTDVEKILSLFGWKVLTALKFCDQPLCVSDYSRREITRMLPFYEKSVKIVHNGVDTSIYRPNSRLKENNLISYLAFTSRRKRLHLLIEAMKYLQDWKLIVGGGPRLHENVDREDPSIPIEYQDNWQYWIWCHKLSEPYKNRVEWCGNLSITDKIRLYQRSTVFCLPSRMEAWGVVLLESISCGTPVVACNVGGIPEFIPKPQLLSSDPTPEEIADHIVNVSRHPEWNNINRKIAENYDWKVVKKEVENVIS